MRVRFPSSAPLRRAASHILGGPCRTRFSNARTDYIDGDWTIDDTVRLASLLKDGGCDLVARAAMRDPHFALSAAEQLGEVAPWPPQLERARRVRPPREPR